MIPDYQSLMRPVLELAAKGETHISDAVDRLQERFDLSEEERGEMLPSGQQTRFANRVHWARSYLKMAGLVRNPRRGRFEITPAGRKVLETGPETLSAKHLAEIAPDAFRAKGATATEAAQPEAVEPPSTPEERISAAHGEITAAVADDVLDRVRAVSPKRFEQIILDLMLAMGYGRDAGDGRVLGGAGDDGVDGVINLDRLGVDQVYVQAKRYGTGNTIGSGAIRDFFGALALKDVSKGIFVTTSGFSPAARETAAKLNARIVLIDGAELARMMVGHKIGVRVAQRYVVPELDEGFFE